MYSMILKSNLIFLKLFCSTKFDLPFGSGGSTGLTLNFSEWLVHLLCGKDTTDISICTAGADFPPLKTDVCILKIVSK